MKVGAAEAATSAAAVLKTRQTNAGWYIKVITVGHAGWNISAITVKC